MDNINADITKLSKRDGLKIGLTGLASLVGVAVSNKFNESSVHLNENGAIRVETVDGNFFPMPDYHGLPYEKKELDRLPKLDAVGFEFSCGQDLLVNGDVEKIASIVVEKNTAVYEGRSKIPSSEIQYFADNGTLYFFEGQIPSSSVALSSFGVETAEFLGAMGYLFKRSLNIKDNKESGKTDRFDFLDKVIVAYGMAPMADTIMQLTSSFSSEMNSTNLLRRNSLQRIGDHLTSITDTLHPELLVDSFRMLNFSRQLMLIANNTSDNSLRIDLPRIGYKMGAGHGATVEDYLRMGKDFVYQMLKSYPKNIWKKMVELNGGIDVTSITPLFESKFQSKKWNRFLVKDTRFFSLLKEKIS